MSEVIVMAGDPLMNISADEFEAFYKEKNSEKDIADAYAAASNKFWWVEDNVYDYEEGTKDYEAARKETDDWGRLMDYYESRVFEILTKDGIDIPKTGTRAVLELFMKKYGYIDGSGWWIRK